MTYCRRRQPGLINHCLAYHNGSASDNGNGFTLGCDKTGEANHVIKYSIAVNTRSKCIDENHNQGHVTIDHCTAANDAGNEFSFYEFSNSGTFTKNVYAGTWNVKCTQSGNITNCSTGAFASTNPSAGARANP